MRGNELETIRNRIREDREAGIERSIVDYAARFEADDVLIARAYAEVHGEREAAQDAASDAIGPYRIRKELGRGGQGVVYLAEDSRLGRDVALKVLTGLGPGSDDTVRRFRREAEVASRLAHPGICSVHDVGVANGVPYIAMQYIKGSTLAERISESKATTAGESSSMVFFSETTGAHPEEDAESPARTSAVARHEVRDILSVFEKVARALHATHEAGILHRDVKPANIMVSLEGEPMILDFGLARSEDLDHPTLTRTGDLFGTPAYMSPEQITGRRIRLDRRTDVYSLGATLYECLTLRRPFEAPTREGVYQCILTRDAPDPRGRNPAIPVDLKTVLEKALEKDRDRRYDTALELAEELRRVKEYEPIHAKPITRRVRVKRWAQRNPGVAVSLSLFILALLGGLGLAAVLLDRVTDERDRADTHLVAWRRMSDIRLVKDLEEEADEALWPAVPDKVPAMDHWISRATDLLSRRQSHEVTLEELRAEAEEHVVPDDEVSMLSRDETGADVRQAWRFSDLEQQYRHEVFADLCARLSKLGGLLERMRSRREFAATVERLTIHEQQEPWAVARERVEDDPRFDGFQLRPQLGLVPLGPDLDSGLEEFWLLDQTGSKPERDEQGRLAITAETGTVLVLIPGGSIRVGRAGSEEREEVSLSPFLVSKYEMTQAQWQRLSGHNPAWWRAPETKGMDITLRHPVEQISWYDCEHFLPRVGLQLPTEAQWEHACRGGTTTTWWCGGEASSIATRRAGNIAGTEDGHLIHAPVGSFAPNGFGLHDVLGNVWEWCRDGFEDYSPPTNGADGARAVDGVLGRFSRGGGFRHPARAARSSNRNRGTPGERLWGLGCRPVRMVAP